MQLSRASRTTSYSTSFQPPRYSSTSTCGTCSKARRKEDVTSPSLRTTPEPLPPKEKAPRSITRQPKFPYCFSSFIDRRASETARALNIDALKLILKQLPVFSVPNRFHRRAEHTHT